MATGFGGTGTFKTHPNDINDGYLDADYDGWYTAHSNAAKIRHINEHLKPYPWEPGTVMRYRDQDFYLLGIAIDAFLKSIRGPDADAWDVLRKEVFEPIGIFHAPAVRTREDADRDGFPLVQRGLLPDARRPGQDRIAVPGWRRARRQATPAPRSHGRPAGSARSHRQARRRVGRNRTGRHALPRLCIYTRWGFISRRTQAAAARIRHYLPTMQGYGDNEVILFPGRVVAIRMAKVTERNPKTGPAVSDDVDMTLRAVDRLAPF